MNTYTAADIYRELAGDRNLATSLIKWTRGRLIPIETNTGKDVLYQFNTLEAYELLRSLMLSDDTTDKQFKAYDRYMDVLKAML